MRETFNFFMLEIFIVFFHSMLYGFSYLVLLFPFRFFLLNGFLSNHATLEVRCYRWSLCCKWRFSGIPYSLKLALIGFAIWALCLAVVLFLNSTLISRSISTGTCVLFTITCRIKKWLLFLRSGRRHRPKWSSTRERCLRWMLKTLLDSLATLLQLGTLMPDSFLW